MRLEARQHTQSVHQGWKGGGVWGGHLQGRRKKTKTKKPTPPTLGLEVITVLCTQNNWSHQCGCHMESLALPCHRCSPFSGQNPPIKPKLVAKRPLTPPHPSPPGENDPLTFTLQSKLNQVQGKQRQTGLAVSRGRSFLQLQSSSVAKSGNNLICTSAAKLNVTVHAIWPRLPSLSKITAFGFVAAVVAEHSATPQNTGNILMETINTGENIVGGNKQLQPQGAGATPKDSVSSSS